jgi:hypothetical protein
MHCIRRFVIGTCCVAVWGTTYQGHASPDCIVPERQARSHIHNVGGKNLTQASTPPMHDATTLLLHNTPDFGITPHNILLAILPSIAYVP